MSRDEMLERWIERERSADPGPEFTRDVMARVRRRTTGRPAIGRWAAAAAWAAAGAIGLWRVSQVLGPFLPN